MLATILQNYKPVGPAAIAIGVFDGVHLGHQAVLRGMRVRADEQGLIALGLTFDPHPAAYLAPDRALALLSSLSQRTEWMVDPGLAASAVIASFDESFAALSARQFVEKVLVGRLQAREVWVGADFRFGRGRQGGVMELESMGEQFGFSVNVARTVATNGERISSTWVRRLVQQGEMEHVAPLLGRPYTLRGVVVHGKQLGRTIGYPTANLQPDEPLQLLPANGVYAAWASFRAVGAGRHAFGQQIPAAVSVGTNPTTDGVNTTRKVEAYLLEGFDSDVYGQPIDLRFIRRIREELHFDGLNALIEQMAGDVREIEKILNASPTPARIKPQSQP